MLCDAMFTCGIRFPGFTRATGEQDGISHASILPHHQVPSRYHPESIRRRLFIYHYMFIT
jgi:hypothetical protein